MRTDLPEEVQNWLQDNQAVLTLVNKITSEYTNDKDAARVLYYRGADMLHLRKTLVDEEETETEGEDNGGDESAPGQVSLFEVLAFLNYLNPDESIVEKVLVALYVSSTHQEIDKEQTALVHYGNEESIPKPFFIFFFGKDIDARISFDNPGGSPAWTDSGAVGMMQVGSYERGNQS